MWGFNKIFWAPPVVAWRFCIESFLQSEDCLGVHLYLLADSAASKYFKSAIIAKTLFIYGLEVCSRC